MEMDKNIPRFADNVGNLAGVMFNVVEDAVVDDLDGDQVMMLLV